MRPQPAADRQSWTEVLGAFFSWLQEFACYVLYVTTLLHRHALFVHQIVCCVFRNIVLEELTCDCSPAGLLSSTVVLVLYFHYIDCRNCRQRFQ